MLKSFKGLIISMLTVFKHIFKNPVTLEYPEKKIIPPKNFRGMPIVEGCIKCGTCIKVCPSGAIKIDGNCFNIDMKKCIFCGNCAYYCPKNCIKMSNNYELASSEKNDLSLKFDISKKGEK